MKIYVLFHIEHKNDVTILQNLCIIDQELQGTRVSSSVRFDNNCDVICMFKLQWNRDLRGISVS